MDAPESFRCGFVSLTGCPNVGKSTLLNRLVEHKVSIVSPRPQTTRHRILGIRHEPGAQIILVDTPGIHPPRHALTRALVETADAVLEDVDLVVLVSEPPPGLVRVGGAGAATGAAARAARVGPGDEAIVRRLEELGRSPKSVVLVINKVDLLRKHLLLPLIEAYAKRYDFADIVPLSALTGDNVAGLVRCLRAALPEGPALYPAEQLTDRSPEFRMIELVREKVLELTREEVPYSVAVALEGVESKESIVVVHAIIYVERESQRGILIGKGGARIREIGQRAREEIELLLGRHVYLELLVKVLKDWRERADTVRRLGYSET